MKLDLTDLTDLRPLIDAVVLSTLDQIRAYEAKLDARRIGYPESEAAELLGIARHVLRDARLRGEIHARKIGKGYIYPRDALLRFLHDVAQR